MTGVHTAVTEALQHELDAGRVDGAQVLVTRHGEPLIDLAIGTCPVTDAAITPQTRFPWYSATKPISAAAFHLLRLDLDRPVASYLPGFGRHGKDAITLRHVLTHTAGIPDAAGRLSLDAFTDADRLRSEICALPLEQPPGQVAYHAHTATAVLAVVAESVSGRPFEELVRTTVLEPLGLRTTGWHPDARTTCIRSVNDELAGVADEWRTATTTAVLPAGGLYGSARDLARFYDGLAVLLGASTLAEVARLAAPWSPRRTLGFGLHVIVGTDPQMPTSRGIGFSPAAFGHPGWTCTVAVHDPATAVTVVVLTNVALPQDDSDARLSRICDTVNRVLQ